MKAYVFTEKGVIRQQEIPEVVLSPETEEHRRGAILRPRFITPCSSDVHTVFAGNGPRRPGLVLGHEGLAEVLETGPEVRDFHPGELVAVSAVMPEVPDGTGHEGYPFSGSQLGRNRNGMWSERFYVPDADQNLGHIPKGLRPEQAIISTDVMPTGFTAAEEAGIAPGQTVAVLGLGAVGLMAVAAAKLRGAGLVIGLGSPERPESLELAKDYGADLLLSYRDGSVLFDRQGLLAEPFGERTQERQGETERERRERHPLANSTKSPGVDRILDLTQGQGVDRVLICGGAGNALAQACDILRYGTGVAVNVAYFEGSGTVGLPVFSLGRGMAGKTFRFAFCRGGRNRIEAMMELIRQGRVPDPGRLVTHRLSGSGEIPRALEMMREKPQGLLKVMVEIEEW